MAFTWSGDISSGPSTNIAPETPPEPIVETRELDIQDVNDEEVDRKTDLVVTTVTLEFCGQTIQHEIDEVDGRYWISKSQYLRDDGTGFATVDDAIAKIRRYYEGEANFMKWQEYMRATPPPERVI